MDLSGTRYRLGLSSIVELSHAQLQQTQAEFSNAQASYDYRLGWRTQSRMLFAAWILTGCHSAKSSLMLSIVSGPFGFRSGNAQLFCWHRVLVLCAASPGEIAGKLAGPGRFSGPKMR